MSSIAEEFEKRQNIKAKTVTTINTGTRHDDAADALSEFARFKLREQNAVYGLDTGEGKVQSAWTTFKINAPVLEDVSENIDRILESSDLMKSINELYLRDTQEVYVRELLNRVKELQAEVQEANDNAAWWRNRYTAIYEQKEAFESRSLELIFDLLDEYDREEWENINYIDLAEAWLSILDESYKTLKKKTRYVSINELDELRRSMLLEYLRKEKGNE